MTDKNFYDYNDYHDRGMVKWQTAFALGELVSAIDKGSLESTKNIPRFPQQSTEEIQRLLEISIKHNKVLEVQLNELDDLGRTKEYIIGNYRGFVELDVLMIGESYINFADIRHIKLRSFKKWSDLTETNQEDPFQDISLYTFSEAEEREMEETFNEFFNDDSWLDD